MSIYTKVKILTMKNMVHLNMKLEHLTTALEHGLTILCTIIH